MLILLNLFNPMVTSLRGIQQASVLQNVQRKLGCSRASLGSLSEAASVFDPDRLRAIISEPGRELESLGRNTRLKDLDQTLTLVDETLIAALPKLMQASFLKRTTGSGLMKWRLHTHFEVDRYVPTRIDITPNGGGGHDERSVLARNMESDRRYVMDRGYAKFALLHQIVAARSSYVCQLRDNSAYDVIEVQPFTHADRGTGILSDPIVRMGKTGKADAVDLRDDLLLLLRHGPRRGVTAAHRHVESSGGGPGQNRIGLISDPFTNTRREPLHAAQCVSFDGRSILAAFSEILAVVGHPTIACQIEIARSIDRVSILSRRAPEVQLSAKLQSECRTLLIPAPLLSGMSNAVSSREGFQQRRVQRRLWACYTTPPFGLVGPLEPWLAITSQLSSLAI